MSDCILCEIVRGEAPSHKVWEDESFLAVLTIEPLNAGHTLIIPKAHVDYIFDLEEPLYTDVFQAAKQLAQPIREAAGAKRVGVVVEGFTVPHAHVHLIPLHGEDEIDPRRVMKMSAEQLAEVGEKIRSHASRQCFPLR
ncbi:MAG TPA: HIT family protein [Pyrinomonadaceae bacterium]|nr:HIT family protein [Pyrinomonadaceae bacterium]